MVLPGGLKSDKADATMEDGVLTLTIPKAEEVKPKAIKVKAKEKKWLLQGPALKFQQIDELS